MCIRDRSIGVTVERSRYKRSGKLSRADTMKRIKNARKLGYQGHAHRFDESFMYQQQMKESGVPRELEVEDADARTGKKTGQPYKPEKDYLDSHPWKQSKVYRILCAHGTNAGRAALASSSQSSSHQK